MKRKNLLSTCVWLFAIANLLAQPTDNPFDSYYNDSDGYPAWTMKLPGIT